MKPPSDDVVAIYAKMDAEAAAAQMATMDESGRRRDSRQAQADAASAILNEMDAAQGRPS